MFFLSRIIVAEKSVHNNNMQQYANLLLTKLTKTEKRTVALEPHYICLTFKTKVMRLNTLRVIFCRYAKFGTMNHSEKVCDFSTYYWINIKSETPNDLRYILFHK
jgi:hypothetical protein